MTTLALSNAHARMLKISINVLGKDADNTLFTLPLEGIELTREELNAILGDRTFEAWYVQRKDKSWHPMDFWRARKNGSFEIDDEFTADAVTIVVSGDKTLEFESIEADEDDEEGEDQPAAKIHSLVFTPTAGGVTKLALHLQVRPGIGNENLTLQEHQYRPVTLTLIDVQEAKRKGGQQSLPLTNGAEEGRAVSGGFAQTKSAEEIDAEMRRRYPDSPTMGEDKAFEEGARAQVAAFNAKPGEVIDGRSERVKHRDARRGKSGSGARHR